MSSKKVQAFAIGLASIVALGVVASAVSSTDDGGSKPGTNQATPAPKPNDPPKEPEGDTVPQPPLKSIEGFKACIQQKGMVAEKTAGTHVTKLSGMDDWNGILDNPKIWTNYKGGFAAHAAEGNVLASVFADCYSSKNGLVTVYGEDGHVIGTGQF